MFACCHAAQTQQRYHPAKTWSSQVQGINGMVARWGYFGFVATSEGRQLRDVAGQQLQVRGMQHAVHVLSP
jgi:hypothetical protein